MLASSCDPIRRRPLLGVRTPPRRSRMLACYDLPESVDERRGWRPALLREGTVRVPVSQRLLRMARFGLDCTPDDSSGWWRRVEDEMQALVRTHLPAGATGVRMRLDAERMEVVLSYEPASEPQPGRRAV